MSRAPRIETIADYFARDEDDRIELIRGVIVDKAEATGEHSAAQFSIGRILGNYFQRKPGGAFPGGWWFFTELEVQLGEEMFRPDVSGFRRESMPEPTRGRPCLQTPDWVCEILSPSKPGRDRVLKLDTYWRARVPHYWIIDPVAGTLEVFRHTEQGCLMALGARREDRVRAEPFDAIELRIAELLGDDPED